METGSEWLSSIHENLGITYLPMGVTLPEAQMQVRKRSFDVPGVAGKEKGS